MSYGHFISIRKIIREAYPKCLCSVVHDENTGTTYDPEKLGDDVIRHAEIMHEEAERLRSDAARIVLAKIKEQAQHMNIENDYDGAVIQEGRSGPAYGSVTEWIEALEVRIFGSVE